MDLVDHGFDNFEPFKTAIAPPADCPGPWASIVLDLDGSVKGRQYDRIARIEIGGVTVLRTSTPEPSREGIAWHVEKDLSRYAPLFTRKQDVAMELGNVVNETYTGVFQINAKITFYQIDAQHSAIASADQINALNAEHRDGLDYIGSFMLPRAAERAMIEAYTTGSGGGCEEFWYLAAPKEVKYSCTAEQGPYREVQLLVDGRVAGIALPYPNVWTGGWSNPFLWYVLPAPRTFDIHPIEFDITPLIGTLNDDKPHELRLHVLGVGADSKGWSIQAALYQWLDPSGKATRGKLREYELGQLALSHPAKAGKDGTATTTNAAHELRLSGELETSHGKVVTSIAYRLGNRNEHRWDKDENHDHLKAEWTDRITVTRSGGGKQEALPEVHEFRYAIGGEIFTQKIEGKERLTTEINIDDVADVQRGNAAHAAGASQEHDHFEGSASYNQKVPREQRHATGHSSERYTRHSPERVCYDKTIEQKNGMVIAQREECSAP